MTTEIPAPSAPPSACPLLYPDFLTALLAGDRRQCTALTQQTLAAGTPILDLYQHLFQRALYRVGELWECNRISVATEHLATSIVEGLLNQLYPEVIGLPRVNKSVVIASVEGELHQVGAKMVCDVFEMHGWDAFYLGADTPTRELLHLVRERHPDAVGLSLSVYFHLGALQDMIWALRAEHPDLPILIGGQGLRRMNPTLIADPQVYYLADLDELNRFFATLTPPDPEGRLS